VGWTEIYAFLVFTFLVHLVVFALRYSKTRNKVNLLLCGTFSALTLMFYLKYRGLDWPVGYLTVQAILRMVSAGCTLMAVYLGFKRIQSESEVVGELPTPLERRERRRERRRGRRSR